MKNGGITLPPFFLDCFSGKGMLLTTKGINPHLGKQHLLFAITPVWALSIDNTFDQSPLLSSDRLYGQPPLL